MTDLQEEAESYLRSSVSTMGELYATINGINELVRRPDAKDVLLQKTYDGLNGFLEVLLLTEEVITIPERVGRLTLYLELSTDREKSGSDNPTPNYWGNETKLVEQRIKHYQECLERYIKSPMDLRVAPLLMSLPEIIPSSQSIGLLTMINYNNYRL